MAKRDRHGVRYARRLADGERGYTTPPSRSIWINETPGFVQRHESAIIVAVGVIAGVILGWSTAAYGLGVR